MPPSPDGTERSTSAVRKTVRMPRYVALLGGINVGGHRVAMERLRTEFEALGHSDVATFIASGNVMFTAPRRRDHESRIAAHLEAQLGWPVPTFVRTAAELVAAADLRPFGRTPDGHTHMVAFCRDAPDADAATTIEASGTEVDRFEVHGREVHWLIHGTVMSSKVNSTRLGKLTGPVTTRNITSLERLADLVR